MNQSCYLLATTVLSLIISLSYSVRLEKKNKIENDDVYVLQDISVEEFIITNSLSTPQECTRTCKLGRSKKCYYRFHLEQYSVLGKACELCKPNNTNGCQCILADGIERSAFTVNRMIPGPTIEVCEKDTIIVDVVNLIPASAVTIHWHGILQRGSQFYDGVPYVTQCPILPGNTFRYTWKANDPGTHFWHSHTGLQKIDGLSGPIIVRQPKLKTPLSSMYDFDLSEHIMFLQDWCHKYMDEQLPGNINSKTAHRPDTILVNGKGKFQDPTTKKFTNVSSEVFKVYPNHRYRFRMINALASICPIQVTIENHKMIVIATDGHPVKPIEVNTIISTSAERYDFILQTNDVGGTYWIHIKALEDCKALKINQVAVLQYTIGLDKPKTPRPTYTGALPIRKVLNPLNANCDELRNNAICINQLSPDGYSDKDILGNNIVKIYLPFRFVFHKPQDFFKPNTYEKHFVASGAVLATGLIDNITFQSPPSPLLSQYYDLNFQHFCNGDQHIENCGSTCKCTHVIKVQYNSIVELILVDEVHETGLHHPFHLHGHAFHVMGIGKMPESGKGTLEEAINLDKQNRLNRRYDYPPLKDTIMIPSNGYVVLRFRANNPGFWFLHCHFLMHLVTGMSAVLQVGNVESMPSPPDNFPKCGNYLPNL